MHQCMTENDNVLLKLPSGTIKPVLLKAGSLITLGKFGSFKADLLFNEPYGIRYEIIDQDSLKRVHPEEWTKTADTDATNEKIKLEGVQELTAEEIAEMRKAGITADEIIEKQIQGHAAFELKTDYSKEKYRRRKEAKYTKLFTPLEPTLANIGWYMFETAPSKIRDLRPDTLGQVINYANVAPGGRVLVVDDLHGLVTGGVLQRMQGQGTVFIINDADSPPDLHLLKYFNFDPLWISNIQSLHWAATDPAYKLPQDKAKIQETDNPSGNNKRTRIKKREETQGKLRAMHEEFLKGGFTSLVCASRLEPLSVLQALKSRLAGSASVAVYGTHLEPLSRCQQLLRSDHEWLNPQVLEPWLRKYQVLHGRTHPEMNGMGFGGYFLITTRVFENPDAHAYAAGRKKRRRDNRESVSADTEPKDFVPLS